jgi:tetratricopeptide (TPR) repeat protein
VAWALAVVLVAGWPALSPAMDAGPLPLAVGSGQVRPVAAGETVTWSATLVSGRAYRLSVEQRGVDVEVTATAPDGSAVAVDNPFDRSGSEELLLEPAAGQGGGWVISVRGREPGAPAGQVAVRLAPSDADVHLPAWRAVTRAGVAYRIGGRQGRDGRERALAEQLTAYSAWRALGQRSEAATALYASAVLARLLDRPQEALGSAREVLGLWEELSEPRWAAATENEIGLDLWLGRDPAAARGAFERSAAGFAALGDSYGEGSARANICLLIMTGGELAAGLACHEKTMPLLEAAGAPSLAAAALTSAGRAYDLLGDPEAAAAAYKQALAHAGAAGEEGTVARALNNLAVLHQRMGEPDAAVAAHGRALDSFRRLGDRRWQALSLHNLGLLYLRLGDLDQASAHAAEALGLWEELGELGGEAAALTTQGLVERRRGRFDAARGLLARAVELRQQGTDRRAQGEALSQLAFAELAAGDVPAARRGFTAALERLAGSDPVAEGDARRGLAQALLAAGEPAAARAELQAVLAAMRAHAYRVGEGQALYWLARVERADNRLDVALAAAGEAVAVSQSLRGAGGPDLRASAAEVRHEVDQLYLELLMDAHQRTPTAGYDRRALEASEGARARTLRELLAEARVDLQPEAGSPAAALLIRKRSLERQLAARLERSWRGTAASQARGPAGREGQEGLRPDVRTLLPDHLREEQALLAELDRVEAELRGENPAYAALVPAAPLGEAAIRGLLDPETVLLVYALGDERSVLWRVTPAVVESFALPPRAAIEKAALDLQALLSRFDPDDRPAQAAAATALSNLVLGPLASQLGSSPAALSRRVAVIPDGALAYVPFGVLSVPTGEAGAPRPLLLDYEVVVLPSASALAAQRRLLADRAAPTLSARPAGNLIAIIADPRLTPEPVPSTPAPGADPASGSSRHQAPDIASLPGKRREAESISALTPTGAEPAPTRAETSSAPTLELAPESAPMGFAPLPGTRREAEAIAALAPDGQATLLLGASARRETVLGDRLRGYRYLHFATHGLIDAERPAASGLLLSTFDDASQPTPGFLHLRDIYGLRLDADLVVLSGCRTAVGRIVRGEGLAGLSRGFLAAGVPRVIASLWPVDDRATAELAARFYRGLWEEGLAPAAALRQAQLHIRAQRRWQDPFFWGGFVLEGPW